MVGIFKSPAHLGKQNDVSFPCHVSWNAAVNECAPKQVLTPSGNNTKLSGMGICFCKAYHSEKHPETNVTYHSSNERKKHWIWNLKECNNCIIYILKDLTVGSYFEINSWNCSMAETALTLGSDLDPHPGLSFYSLCLEQVTAAVFSYITWKK